MCRDIENPMVIDSLWREREQESKVIGECSGCEEDIYSNEQWFDFVIKGENYLAHQDKECCYQFIAEMSISRGGEE